MGVVGYRPIMSDRPFIHSVNTLIKNSSYVCIAVTIHWSVHAVVIILKQKIYDIHIWQVAGYLTDSNVPHNIVLQMKQLNIYFGVKVSIEQVFTMSSLP